MFQAGIYYQNKTNGKIYYCYQGNNGLRFKYKHKDVEYNCDINGMNYSDFVVVS